MGFGDWLGDAAGFAGKAMLAPVTGGASLFAGGKGGIAGGINGILGAQNPTNYDVGGYGFLNNVLQGQIQGQGPNLAEKQLELASGRLGQQTASSVAGAKGISPGLKQQMVLDRQGQLNASLGAQSGLLRMQQQLAAQQQLTELLKAGMGANAGAAAQNAQLNAGLVGGLLQGAGAAIGLAGGGEVPHMEGGGVAGGDLYGLLDSMGGFGPTGMIPGVAPQVQAPTDYGVAMPQAGIALPDQVNLQALSNNMAMPVPQDKPKGGGQPGGQFSMGDSMPAFQRGVGSPRMFADGGKIPPVVTGTDTWKPPEYPLPEAGQLGYEGETAKKERAAKAKAAEPKPAPKVAQRKADGGEVEDEGGFGGTEPEVGSFSPEMVIGPDALAVMQSLHEMRAARLRAQMAAQQRDIYGWLESDGQVAQRANADPYAYARAVAAAQAALPERPPPSPTRAGYQGTTQVSPGVYKVSVSGAERKAGGGPVFMADGTVPGRAQVAGDSYQNDTVEAMLSPGEIVIPRSIAQSPNAPEEARAFVEHLMRRKGSGYGKVVKARGKMAEGGEAKALEDKSDWDPFSALDRVHEGAGKFVHTLVKKAMQGAGKLDDADGQAEAVRRVAKAKQAALDASKGD